MRSAALLALGIGCGFSANGANGADGGVRDTALDSPIASDAPTSDGVFAVDASSPDAFVPPPPPATCGAPPAMPDDIDPYSTTADWAVKNISGASGDTVTLGGYASTAYVISVPTVSLVSAAATVQVQTPIGSAGTMAFFAAWPDGSAYDLVGFEVAGSGLEVGSWPGSGSASIGSAAFDGSAMTFWQISESAGTVSFATSPDGSAWSAPLYTVPTPVWAPYAHVALDAYGAATYSATYTELDGSNAGSAMPWCDADTFHGAPGSDSIATWWSNTPTTNTACTFEGSGAITATGQGCWYATSSRYNLVDSSVTVHWGSDTQAAAQPIIALLSAGATDNGEYFYAANGYLYDYPGDHYIAHTFSAADTDAYWRVTEYSVLHELELAISSDGVTWTPALLVPEPFVPSAIVIGAGLNATGSGRVLGVN